MRSRRVALIVLLGTFAAFLLSPQLLGHELRHAHPLHIYHPPHVPLQYLHFAPVPAFHSRYHFWYHYGAQAFPYVLGHPWVVLPVGFPIVRERITIRERTPTRKPDKHRSLPSFDFWVLALKDGPMYAVTDYWLEDEALHYVERDGSKSSVPLKDIDLSFTKRINRRLGKPFRLPRSDP